MFILLVVLSSILSLVVFRCALRETAVEDVCRSSDTASSTLVETPADASPALQRLATLDEANGPGPLEVVRRTGATGGMSMASRPTAEAGVPAAAGRQGASEQGASGVARRPRQRKQRGLFSFGLSILRAEQGELPVAETLHAWAVTVCTAHDGRCCGAWLAAVASGGLILLQLCALYIVMNECAHPACLADTDCPAGLYCGANGFGGFGLVESGGRCSDCKGTCYWILSKDWPRCDGLGVEHKDALDRSRQCEKMLGGTPVATPNHGEVTLAPWIDDQQGGALLRPWDEFDYAIAERMSHVADSGIRQCQSQQHCSETDVHPVSCDHVHTNLAVISDTRNAFMLVLIACIFAVPLYSDMESAANEEALLDHRLQSRPPSQLAARSLRVGLRIRRFVLPWLLSITAVAVLLTGGQLSVISILLNLLAVTFLLDADDMLALLLLSPSSRELPNQAFDECWRAGRAPKTWLFARVSAIGCAVYVVYEATAGVAGWVLRGTVSTWWTGLVPFMAASTGSCDDLDTYFAVAPALPILIAILLQALYEVAVLPLGVGLRDYGRAVLSTLSNASFNLGVFLVVACLCIMLNAFITGVVRLGNPGRRLTPPLSVRPDPLWRVGPPVNLCRLVYGWLAL